jgi:hypothetical protein
MCGCFVNMCTCIYCFLCVVSFMYIYSYLFCLYLCKDYCHRVTSQLQLVVVVIIIIIIIIITVIAVKGFVSDVRMSFTQVGLRDSSVSEMN